ncbi:hypothetical protein ACNKHR_07915 [Shigella flexneri]
MFADGVRKLSGSRTCLANHSRSTELRQLSRRNLHALSLNIFKDEGREAFLKLMETTDIFIEASKGRPLPVVALPMKYCGSTTRNWLSLTCPGLVSTAPRSTPIFRPITPSPRPSVVT